MCSSDLPELVLDGLIGATPGLYRELDSLKRARAVPEMDLAFGKWAPTWNFRSRDSTEEADRRPKQARRFFTPANQSTENVNRGQKGARDSRNGAPHYPKVGATSWRMGVAPFPITPGI